jgi:alpha-D-ribose 1-methylphosphonate 5-triphosphate diphosphatase PhnM
LMARTSLVPISSSTVSPHSAAATAPDDCRSGIFQVTHRNHFPVEVGQKARHLFLCAFDNTGNFHIIKSTDHCAAGNTLNKTKFLPGFGGDGHSLEFMIFT